MDSTAAIKNRKHAVAPQPNIKPSKLHRVKVAEYSHLSGRTRMSGGPDSLSASVEVHSPQWLRCISNAGSRRVCSAGALYDRYTDCRTFTIKMLFKQT
jgi:hypothetical protein